VFDFLKYQDINQFGYFMSVITHSTTVFKNKTCISSTKK